jgi:hypothetical protein
MSTRAPEEGLWNILRGALTTRALAIAADLGVADRLVDGPRPVAQLAGEVGADPDVLHRVLRALASDGVFAEEQPGVFANTPTSELLLEGRPTRDFAHLFGGVFYRAVAGLDGRPYQDDFARIFGSGFWQWLAEHPDERTIFDRAMEAGKERRTERLGAIELGDGKTVVDVGGGNGSLLVELLRRRPGLRGIVFDLPETNRDESALAASGIEFHAGSFFESVPSGDLYLLGTVLHDWDDERATAILRTIRTSAPPQARVAILDSVIPPGNEPSGAKWLDLLMLVLSGGRERSEPEWRVLVEAAGFRVDAIQDGLIQASCR